MTKAVIGEHIRTSRLVRRAAKESGLSPLALDCILYLGLNGHVSDFDGKSTPVQYSGEVTDVRTMREITLTPAKIKDLSHEVGDRCQLALNKLGWEGYVVMGNYRFNRANPKGVGNEIVLTRKGSELYCKLDKILS